MSSPPRYLVVFCFAILCASQSVCAQDENPPLPDSPSYSKKVAQDGPDSPAARQVTWRSLPAAILQDQKAIWWTFPGQLVKGRHLLPTLTIVGGTAAIIYADPHAMPYFRSHARNLDDINDTFDTPITSAEVILLPASLIVCRLHKTRRLSG